MSTTVEAEATEGGTINDGNLNMAQEQTSRRGFCSVRHGLALIVHLCNFSISTQQINMSIAMPAMVNNTALPTPLNASIEGPPTDSQDNWNETLKEVKAVAAMYDWSPEIQGIILSSPNYCSFLAPIPCGYMAEMFGVKYLTSACLLISSVLNLFIPLAADTGVTWLIVLRIFQGIAQVMVLTSQYSIWTRWAPPLERSQLITLSVSGSVLGSCTILFIGGFLCQTLGWPTIFYIFGAIGCFSSFLWFALVYDDPMNHPFISTSEKEYIVCSLAQEDSPPGWSLPIKAMIKSLPLWSILIFYFTDYWYYYIITSYTPTYISSVLEVNIRDNGILSALPYVSAYICIVLGGLLADYLFSRKILRLNTIRKLFTVIGVVIPSAFTVSLFWVRSSFGATIAFLILAFSFKSIVQSGALINFMDIAPRHGTLLRGLSQIFSYLSGTISPTVSGFLISQVRSNILMIIILTRVSKKGHPASHSHPRLNSCREMTPWSECEGKENAPLYEFMLYEFLEDKFLMDSEVGWRNVFLLSFAVGMAGLIFYLIFGQAERSGKKRSEQKVEKEVTAMKFGCREEERDTRASAGRYGIKEGV